MTKVPFQNTLDDLPVADETGDRDVLHAMMKETRTLLQERGIHVALYEGVRIFAGIFPFLATLVAMKMAAGKDGPLETFHTNNEFLSSTLRTGMAFGAFNEFCDVLARTDKALFMDTPANEKLAFVGRGLAREMAVELPATMLGATMLVLGPRFQKLLGEKCGITGLAGDALANGIAFDAYLRVRGAAKQGINAAIDWIADHWPGNTATPETLAQESAERTSLKEKLAKFAFDELAAVAAFAIYKAGQNKVFALAPEGGKWTDVTPTFGQPGAGKTFSRLMDVGVEGYVPFIAVAEMLRFKEEWWKRTIPNVFHRHHAEELDVSKTSGR